MSSEISNPIWVREYDRNAPLNIDNVALMLMPFGLKKKKNSGMQMRKYDHCKSVFELDLARFNAANPENQIPEDVVEKVKMIAFGAMLFDS